MPSISVLLTRPVTYLRVVFVLLGAALALSFVVVDASLILLVARIAPAEWVTFLAAAVIVVAPTVLLGWMPAVQRVEAVAAETFLGVRFPDGTPSASLRASRGPRVVAWFMLHVVVGGITIVVIAVGFSFAAELVAAPAAEPGSSLWPVTELRTTGGWADAWMPPLGLVVALAVVAIPIVLGAGMARAAPAMLGPSYAERLDRLETETARLGERNRIAREIHDSVGHALSLVTMHATAARKLRGRDPEFADSALETIESTARAASADLDHALGLLRAHGSEPELVRAPAPDLRHLSALLAATRSAGLDVDAAIGADLDTVPGVISREAYRLIQEGLTNALRHGADHTAQLEIMRERGQLVLGLRNPAGAGQAPRRLGRGIRGLQERVDALGGSISSAREGDRWCLTVELPLPADGAT